MSSSVVTRTAQAHRVPSQMSAASLANVVGGEAFLRVATFFAALAIARQYGPEMFGQYATALAAATVATTLADNGLQVAAVEQLSKRSDATRETYAQILLSKSMLSAIAAVVLTLVPIAVPNSHNATVVWLLVSLRTLLQSFAQLNFSVLKALQRTSAIRHIQSGHAICLLVLTLLTVSLHQELSALLVAMVICEVLEVAASQIWLLKAGITIASASIRGSLRLVRENAPLGMTATASALVLRFDVLCLSLFAAAAKLGLYAAAQLPMIAIYVSAWLFGSIALADMSALVGDDLELKKYVRHWSSRVLWITVPGTGIALWAAPVLLTRFFGEQFRDAAPVSSILLLATPFVFLNSLRLNEAIAKRESRIYSGIFVGSLALGGAVVLAAARSSGATGVAAVATAREVGLFVVLTLAGRGWR